MADEPKKIPNIRTFKTDAEFYLKESKLSPLEAATRAYEAGQKAPKKPVKINKKLIIWLIVIILFLAGGFFGYILYSNRVAEQSVKIVEPKEYPAFIAVDSEKQISFDEGAPQTLTRNIQTEFTDSFKFGSIIYFPIKITKKDASFDFADSKLFMDTLGWNPPQDFLDNAAPEFNLLITYSQISNDPVFLMKTNNFSKSYGGALAWEATMPWDLKAFLPPEIFNASSTALTIKAQFQDDLIKNNDARVLKDSTGKVILGYTFFNKKFIIISTSRDAIELILSRLIAVPPR